MCISNSEYSERSFKLNLGDLVYNKTFEEEMEEQRKIKLAISHIENFGVKVVSEYGFYRNIYNILKDLGECLDKKVGKMRDSTLEEQKCIQEHIDKISNKTGINFYDSLGLEEPNFAELKNPFIKNNFENKACENCSSNPKNGGNGICFCTLGTPVIY